METPPGHRQQRERLRDGDEPTFAQLYQEHVAAVYGLAHRMTGNRSTAEDVTSETFLAAWRGRDRVEVHDGPLRGWLLGIAAHQSLNATRSMRRRLSFLARQRDEPVVPDVADGVVGRLDDVALLARTRDAVARLTRAEAEVVGLCVMAELSYAEAAEALGIPVGTVRSRLARARARLRHLTADPPRATGTTTDRTVHPPSRGAR